jgi:hypothetical protein
MGRLLFLPPGIVAGHVILAGLIPNQLFKE